MLMDQNKRKQHNKVELVVHFLNDVTTAWCWIMTTGAAGQLSMNGITEEMIMWIYKWPIIINDTCEVQWQQHIHHHHDNYGRHRQAVHYVTTVYTYTSALCISLQPWLRVVILLILLLANYQPQRISISITIIILILTIMTGNIHHNVSMELI